MYIRLVRHSEGEKSKGERETKKGLLVPLLDQIRKGYQSDIKFE